MLDVSRTTVRSAVAVLEAEGLLGVRRGRGGGLLVQSPVVDPAERRRRLREDIAAVRDAAVFRLVVETGAARSTGRDAGGGQSSWRRRAISGRSSRAPSSSASSSALR